MPRQQHPRFHTHDGFKPIELSISPFNKNGVATLRISLSRNIEAEIQAGLLNSSIYIPKQYRAPFPGQRHSSPGECDLVLKIFPRLPLARETPPVTKEGMLISSGAVSVCDQCKVKRSSLLQLQGIVETFGSKGTITEHVDSQRLPLADGEVHLELRICCPPHHHTFLSDPIGYIFTFELYRGKQVLLTHTIENAASGLSPRALHNVTGERTFPLRRCFPQRVNRLPVRSQSSHDTPAVPRPVVPAGSGARSPSPSQASRRATAMSISHLVREQTQYSASARASLLSSPSTSAPNSPRTTHAQASEYPAHVFPASERRRLMSYRERPEPGYWTPHRSFSCSTSSSGEQSSPTPSSPVTTRSSPGPFSPTRCSDAEVEAWRSQPRLHASPVADGMNYAEAPRQPSSPTFQLPRNHHHLHRHYPPRHRYDGERSNNHPSPPPSATTTRSDSRPTTNSLWYGLSATSSSSSSQPPPAAASGYDDEEQYRYYSHWQHHHHHHHHQDTRSTRSERSPPHHHHHHHHHYYNQQESAEHFHRSPQPVKTSSRVGPPRIHEQHHYRGEEVRQPRHFEELHVQQNHPQRQQQQHQPLLQRHPQQQPPLLLQADDARQERPPPPHLRDGSPSRIPPPPRQESPLNDWSLMRGSIVRSPSEASYLDEDEDEDEEPEEHHLRDAAENSRDREEFAYEGSGPPRVPYPFSTSSHRPPTAALSFTWSPSHRSSAVRHHPYGHYDHHHPSSFRPASPHSVYGPRSMIPAPSSPPTSRLYEYERRSMDYDHDMTEYDDDESRDRHYHSHKTALKQDQHSPASIGKARVPTGAHREEQNRAESSSSKPSDTAKSPSSSSSSSSAEPGKPPNVDVAISLLQIRSASW